MKRLTTIIQKTQGMTLGELTAETVLRARRKAATAYRRSLDHPQKTYVTDGELARALKNASVKTVAQRIRQGGGILLTQGFVNLASTAACLKHHFPSAVETTVNDAEAILKHEIKIFARRFPFGETIDWHADIETGVRWPLAHYSEMPLALGKLSDVRAVWELNRLQHFTTLARAYVLSGDERYSETFLQQLTSWCEANPPRFGVNWTVAMEVAIRAVNIIAAMQMCRASKAMTDEFVELILKTLLAHGRFIRANLEFSHRISSNHYLSDLIGLLVIGIAIPEFKESRAWVKFSSKELLKEMQHQVLADGVSFEASIAYHRLATEIFTLFFTLSQAADLELTEAFIERLEKMYEFVRAYLKPDGHAPIIGDSDDGRLLKFSAREATDHAYLLPIAAVLFEEEKFKPANHFDEELIWWFGEAGIQQFSELPISAQPQTSAAFAVGQLYIQRQDALYLISDCGDHGINGRGSHAHSDALSFELFAYGQTFLRDAGTYVYTASKRWRQQFRSTAYHNTARIDGREISEINVDQPFALGANVLPKINEWQSNAEFDLLEAEHHAYLRLAEPVTHRRIITFNKIERYWLLDDIFTGRGNHLFEFFFNFDAGLKIHIQEPDRVIAESKSVALALIPLDRQSASDATPLAELKRTCRWVSPSYRTRLPSSGIIYRLRADVDWSNRMLLIPFPAGDENRVKVICSQFMAGNDSK
ncbi:MAG: alginate lyase family protein [Acidobacteriota bacterium]